MDDYDETTMTLLMDDGSRESIFSLDDCPVCGHYMTHDWDETGLSRAAICLRTGCDFVAVDDRRPMPAAGEGGAT